MGAFSHNNKLMGFMIKNLSDWLVKKGDEKVQKEHFIPMVKRQTVKIS